MKKVLVLGGTGLVGSRIVELLNKRFDLVYPPQSQLDVTSESQIEDSIDSIKPDQILYAAGYTNVDLAEKEKEKCFLLNTEAPKILAKIASQLNIPFHYLSTDYVFDGKKENRPYTEEDEPRPLDAVYAQSKRQGEVVTLDSSSKNSVLRLIMPFSAFYGQKMDIARLILSQLKRGEKIRGVVDQKVNPIFVDDLVMAIAKILEKKATGIYHLAAVSFTTPFEFMKEIARQFGFFEDLIGEMTFAEFRKTRPAKRSQHTWLDISKFQTEFGNGILHTIEEELRLFKIQVDSKGGI